MHGHAQYHGIVHGDRMHAVQKRLALFAIVKLRTLQTSVMGSQKSKNTNK